MLKQTILIAFAILHFNLIFAQTITPQTFNVCGGFINNGYTQLEWSVGESTIIETFEQTGINGAILTNGVLQPLTDKPFIQSVSSNWSNDEIRIFPNPTKGNFELDVLSREQGQLTIQLVDALGSVLKSVQTDYYGFGKIVRFDISRNSSATYYLRINLSAFPGFANKKGSFKILKIN